MSSLFVNVLRQAFKTFDQTNHATFNVNFALLKELTEQLTFRDIHIQPQQFEAVFKRPGRAPCTYVHIFENDMVSMSVFVMREGYTMPLHDHPCMHGLLRGIFGKLKLQCYTKQPLSPNEPLYDRSAREVYVHPNEPKVVDPSTESAVLTPNDSNYHELTAVGGMAAFFDILSPPYEADIPQYGSRRCRFYRVAGTPRLTTVVKDGGLLGKKTEQIPLICLERIPTPLSYYCDTADPSEEVIQCTYLCSVEAYSST
ncbi:PREDICTED: 2-aminoethanethiol dioxygenase [Rhagoletis zephyria]|uniref:2-aminoethanethiol dioxygenase n=1 Tax=Rhagoletis zephyria TaxID=28612 RepID=UPI000811990D|nr:PREDICTED: 2-aminoethanethiol dioxygenase [Rhagoletis zephyria]